MSSTPEPTHEIAPTAQSSKGKGGLGRSVRRAVVAVGSLAVVATAGALVLTNGDDRSGVEGSGAAAVTHRGMVEGTIWVANEGDGSLSAIDAASHRVVTTVAGLEGPHNVQVSPDGTSVWAVSGHDGYAAMLGAASPDLHGVVATGSAPAHVVVSPDGTTVYTSNGADDTVSVIDTATMETVDTIAVGRSPHGLRPSPDGRWIVVANVADTTLSVIDTRGSRRVTDIEVGAAPAQVAFSPDGRFVYASLNGEDAVAKVDMDTREHVDTVAVEDGPIQTYVSEDGRYLLVANQGTEDAPGTTLSVIDTETFTVSATVETGRGAHGVVVDPSSRHAYVTNIYGGDVAVLDLHELQVVARISVGDKPNGVSFSSVPVGAVADNVTLDIPRTARVAGHAKERGHDEGHGEGGH